MYFDQRMVETAAQCSAFDFLEGGLLRCRETAILTDIDFSDNVDNAIATRVGSCLHLVVCAHGTACRLAAHRFQCASKADCSGQACRISQVYMIL